MYIYPADFFTTFRAWNQLAVEYQREEQSIWPAYQSVNQGMAKAARDLTITGQKLAFNWSA